MPALTFQTEQGADGRFYAHCKQFPGSIAEGQDEEQAVEALIATLLDRWDYELHRTLRAERRQLPTRVYTAKLSVAL